MNKRLKGSNRDNSVVRMIEEWGTVSVHQVRLMKFSNIKSSQRMAQVRLQKLALKGRISRWRGEEGYLYSLEGKTALSDHIEATNWVRVWFDRSLKSWEKLHCFLYEQDYGILRTDAFAAVKNTITGQFRFWFVETDLSHSNKFDKVKKYCQLFEKGGYEGRWWVKLTEKFPTVLIVTTSIARKEKILQHIAEENSAGLNFEVRLLRDLREEAMA